MEAKSEMSEELTHVDAIAERADPQTVRPPLVGRPHELVVVFGEAAFGEPFDLSSVTDIRISSRTSGPPVPGFSADAAGQW